MGVTPSTMRVIAWAGGLSEARIFRDFEGAEVPENAGHRRIDRARTLAYLPALTEGAPARSKRSMKVVSSLKTAKKRDKNCRVVRRRGRIFVINKKNPRFKARQG